MRASAGPEPVIAVAYSDVVGPPLAARRRGIAFLRPSSGALTVVGNVRRSAALDAAVGRRPAFLHAAVGGPAPWVAVAGEQWADDDEALATHGTTAAAPRRPRLRGREPARISGGFVALERHALQAYADSGAPRWRHDLQTATPASCIGRTTSEKPSRHAVSPDGAIVAGARMVVHRGPTCVETVLRLARLRADGSAFGPDVVVRLEPPEELWAIVPRPDSYGAGDLKLAIQDDGTALVALSSWQASPGSSGSQSQVLRLVVAAPDGTVRELRTIPGTVRAATADGTSWLLLADDGASSDVTMLVLASDGRHLEELEIPRRNVAVTSLPDGAFVAWRANESDVCGIPLGEDGRRGRVRCQRLFLLDARARRRER